VGGEFFYVDTRTDGQTDLMKLTAAIPNFLNVPKTVILHDNCFKNANRTWYLQWKCCGRESFHSGQMVHTSEEESFRQYAKWVGTLLLSHFSSQQTHHSGIPN